MKCYRVEVAITGREVYLVDAECQKDAMKNWHEGTLDIAEALDAEPIFAEEAS